MNPYLVSGVTGAAPIWHELIVRALRGKPDIWPKQPDGIVGAQICSISGLLPGDSGCTTRFEYFIKGTVPGQTENLKQTVVIDKDTGDIVEPNKPGANVETQEHQVLHDPISIWCLDCPHPAGKSVFIK